MRRRTPPKSRRHGRFARRAQPPAFVAALRLLLSRIPRGWRVVAQGGHVWLVSPDAHVDDGGVPWSLEDDGADVFDLGRSWLPELVQR
jgi:hypothetical protein